MFSKRNLYGRLKLTRRWRKRVLWLVLVLIAATGAAGYYVTRPQRLARYSAAMLEGFTGAEARIDRALWSWSGTIELEGVRLSVPDVPQEAGRLFEAERIVLRPRWWTLATGRLRVGSVLMMRPTMYVTEDYDADLFNFQMLAQYALEDEDDPPLDHLPEIFARHATVAFGTVEDGRYHALDTIGLEGKVRASPDHAAAYYFNFRQRTDNSGPGPILSGEFDLEHKTFAVELDGFRFDQPERNFLSRELRRWWDRLEPSGEVTQISVAYTAEDKLSAGLVLRNGQINVPWERFRSRMTDVSGQFVIGGDQVIVNDVSGVIEDIRYTVNGRIDGLDAEAPFTFRVETDVFDIPDDPQLVDSLPGVIQRQFQRFRPSGRFRAKTTIARSTDDAGQPVIEVDGKLSVINARAAYEFFPFPVHDLTGTIAFTQEKVDVIDLRGLGPNGGELVINGAVAPPAKGARVDLTIVGKDIPLDDELARAMREEHRRIYEALANEPAHRKLIERGVLQASDGADPDLPRFDLGGGFNVTVDVQRPLGLNKKFAVTSTIEPLGVKLLIASWPYPLTITGGRLVISPDQTLIENVSVLSPTGGTATASGVINRADEVAPMVPSITVHRARLPIDALLVASLPAPQDQWVSDLHLSGAVAADGEITGDPSSGEIDFTIAAAFEDAAANPYRGGLLLEHITGHTTIRRGGITIERLTGQHGGGTITAAGTIHWDRPATEFDLTFETANTPFSKSLLGVIPPDSPVGAPLKELMTTYQPTGAADVTLHMRGVVDGEPDVYDATIRPRSLAFDFHNQRIRLTDMSGLAKLRPGQIDLEALTGSFENGSFNTSGHLKYAARREANLTFTARVDRLGLTTRALLPANVVGIVDDLDLNGSFDVWAGQLVLRPDETDLPHFEFISNIRVTGGSARVGVPITDLEGTLNVEIRSTAGVPWPDVSLDLDAAKLRAADRLIAPLRLDMTTDHDTGRLELSDCRGVIYGGSLVGEGWVQLSDEADYSFDLKIHDVDVDSFVRPDRAPNPDADPVYDSGQLSASMLIEARYNDEASRRGRGELWIEHASLYENPLPLAVLHAMNFTLPASRSFQEAAARYIIDGNTVLFDDLRFISPSIQIIGRGSMDWTTLDLDLDMVTRNPKPLLPGAVDEMISVFKDELVTIHVGGTLRQPDARLAPFSGVRESWDSLFGQARAAGPNKPRENVQPRVVND